MVLTIASEAHRIPSTVRTIALDSFAVPPATAPIPSSHEIQLDDLAFVSYSSGTTGRPKGIANPHRAAVGSYALRFQLSDLQMGDRVACNVFFLWEMLRPLLRGATTVTVPDTHSYDPNALLAFLQERQVTETLMTPTLLATILAQHEEGTLKVPYLRTLWLNGEVVTLDLVSRATRAMPGVRLLNVYSISETHEVAAGDMSALLLDPAIQGLTVCPVGPLLDPDHAYILHENSSSPAGPGEAGELCVGGSLLARSYLNLPDQTHKAFVPDPFHVGQRMYRTGDMAKMVNGNLEITGRLGGMIKARGYTVHPAAVEAAVVKYLGASACAVIGVGEGVDKRLVAYVVRSTSGEDGQTWCIEPSGHSPSARKILLAHLAHYMIPTLWVVVDALPTHSVSGKIDLAALPPPPSQTLSARPISPGSTNTAALGARQIREDTLIEQWSLVLGVPEATIKTRLHTFFDLGGHSLSLADLAGKLTKSLGFIVPLGALASDASLEGHLAAITAARDGHLAELQSDLPKVMETDSILPADLIPRIPSQAQAKGNDLLLTGATGYLGAFLLRALAKRTPPTTKIICLIRFPIPMDNCQPAGLARIRNNLNDLGLWHDDFLDRIEVVPGNLPQARLGLEVAAFEQLAKRVGTVVHAAAAVNLVYPYAALRAANVGGTREILRLCALGGASLHHISTNGALPPSDQAWPEDSHIDVHQAASLIPDGYGQSKWVAEQLVLQAQQRGVDARIYRPGTLSGCDQSGASNPYDMLDAVIIESLRLGVAPELEGWKCELTPVNYVADAVAALATTALKIPQQKARVVYHLGDPHPNSATAVFDSLAALGYPTSRLPFEAWGDLWRSTLVDPKKDPNHKTPFTTDILKGGFPSPEALCAVPIMDDKDSQRVLVSVLGYERPRVDVRLWRTYTRHFYARGWLPHAPKHLDATAAQEGYDANGSTTAPALDVHANGYTNGFATANGHAKTRGIAHVGPLLGQVAVVTGASSGIGAAVAEALAAQGASVAIAARRTSSLYAVAKRIHVAHPGSQVLVVPTDVTDPDSVDMLALTVQQELGPVDIVLCGAGAMYFTLLSNVVREQWSTTVDVNIKGLLHCLASFLPGLLERKGHLLAISSDAARKVFPGLGVYSASKMFVDATLSALRLENAGKLKVTSIQPGNVATDLLGMSTDKDAIAQYGEPSGAKVLDPKDVARAVVYAVTQPDHVAVNELLVEPREEPI